VLARGWVQEPSQAPPLLTRQRCFPGHVSGGAWRPRPWRTGTQRLRCSARSGSSIFKASKSAYVRNPCSLKAAFLLRSCLGCQTRALAWGRSAGLAPERGRSPPAARRSAEVVWGIP